MELITTIYQLLFASFISGIFIGGMITLYFAERYVAKRILTKVMADATKRAYDNLVNRHNYRK